jgi:membrane fusion protein (multidrug efflux system)
MAEAQTGNNNKRRKALATVGAIVLAGLVVGFFYNAYRKTHISTDDAFIDGNVHTIASKVYGTVKDISVTDNQHVKQGDLLLEIDPADYGMRLKEASSALGVERAKLSESEARIELAKANLDLQKANLKLAETEMTRAENLYQKEVIPRDRYDRALTDHEVAVAQVKAAEEQLRQSESQRETQISTIRQKEAQVSLAELNYGYTRIHAPADGYVTRKSVQVGNQIQPGQSLMAVVSLDDIWVVANFKETQLERIQPGQPAVIRVDTFPGKKFMGRVDSIMAGTGASFSLFPPENATGNYVKVVQRIPVKIVLEKGADDAHQLRIGMSVVPTVVVK